MPPKLKILVRILAILVVILIATKPYNLFCNSSQKCQPFYLSDIIPRNEGQSQIDVNFIIDNYLSKISISPLKKRIETVSNRINVVEVKVKNNSQRAVIFRPKLIIEPQEYKEYINLHECLCSSKIKLRIGEEKILKMRFSIDKDFDDVLVPARLQSINQNSLFNIKYRIDAQ